MFLEMGGGGSGHTVVGTVPLKMVKTADPVSCVPYRSLTTRRTKSSGWCSAPIPAQEACALWKPLSQRVKGSGRSWQGFRGRPSPSGLVLPLPGLRADFLGWSLLRTLPRELLPSFPPPEDSVTEPSGRAAVRPVLLEERNGDRKRPHGLPQGTRHVSAGLTDKYRTPSQS